MSYDDPFKQIRERLNELARGPFHEFNETLRRQQELYSMPVDRVAEFLDQATTYRSLAQEAGDRLRSLFEEQTAALKSIGSWVDEVAVGTTWLHHEILYEASTSNWLNTLPPMLEDTAIRTSLDALSLPGLSVSGIGTIKRLQDALQTEILKIGSLDEAIPALRLEGELGLLATKLAEPQVASQLLDFRERFGCGSFRTGRSPVFSKR